MILVISSCSLYDSGEACTVRLPELPESWLAALGEPYWKLLLYESGSRPRSEILEPGTRSLSVRLIPGTVYPVLAYPFWPHLRLFPGSIKPAGAVYPADIKGLDLPLSWLGGVSAFFFTQLAAADGMPHTRPELMNWIRFKTLFVQGMLSEAVLTDPWKVDWSLVAAKTRAKGFDRRRIKVEELYSLDIRYPVDGPWIQSSPFLPSLEGKAGSSDTVQTGAQGISLFSSSGILKCKPTAAVFFPYP